MNKTQRNAQWWLLTTTGPLPSKCLSRTHPFPTSCYGLPYKPVYILVMTFYGVEISLWLTQVPCPSCDSSQVLVQALASRA